MPFVTSSDGDISSNLERLGNAAGMEEVWRINLSGD
jgi:hypothetical protein